MAVSSINQQNNRRAEEKARARAKRAQERAKRISSVSSIRGQEAKKEYEQELDNYTSIKAPSMPTKGAGAGQIIGKKSGGSSQETTETGAPAWLGTPNANNIRRKDDKLIQGDDTLRAGNASPTGSKYVMLNGRKVEYTPAVQAKFQSQYNKMVAKYGVGEANRMFKEKLLGAGVIEAGTSASDLVNAAPTAGSSVAEGSATNEYTDIESNTVGESEVESINNEQQFIDEQRAQYQGVVSSIRAENEALVSDIEQSGAQRDEEVEALMDQRMNQLEQTYDRIDESIAAMQQQAEDMFDIQVAQATNSRARQLADAGILTSAQASQAAQFSMSNYKAQAELAKKDLLISAQEQVQASLGERQTALDAIMNDKILNENQKLEFAERVNGMYRNIVNQYGENVIRVNTAFDNAMLQAYGKQTDIDIAETTMQIEKDFQDKVTEEEKVRINTDQNSRYEYILEKFGQFAPNMTQFVVGKMAEMIRNGEFMNVPIEELIGNLSEQVKPEYMTAYGLETDPSTNTATSTGTSAGGGSTGSTAPQISFGGAATAAGAEAQSAAGAQAIIDTALEEMNNYSPQTQTQGQEVGDPSLTSQEVPGAPNQSVETVNQSVETVNQSVEIPNQSLETNPTLNVPQASMTATDNSREVYAPLIARIQSFTNELANKERELNQLREDQKTISGYENSFRIAAQIKEQQSRVDRAKELLANATTQARNYGVQGF